MENQSLLDNFTNVGPVPRTIPINLPDTGATKHKPTKYADSQAGVVKALNANRDMNITHDFDYWSVRDADLADWEAFNAIHRKVLANRQQFNNFSGSPAVDFTNLSEAEIQYYSDFLGGFFKKVGHAIGSVGKAVGHAVGGVATGFAHVVRDGAVGAAHIIRDGAEGIGHGARAIGKDVGRAANWVHKEDVQAHKFLRNLDVKLHKESLSEVGKIAKAVAPYWKDILAVGGTILLAATGVGLPLAIASGAALLTGLNNIPANEPELPPGFGSGASMGMGAESGFPQDGIADEDDDTGANLTPAQETQRQQAIQEQQEAEAAQEAAAAQKKKLMLWGGAIFTVIVVIYFIKRK